MSVYLQRWWLSNYWITLIERFSSQVLNSFLKRLTISSLFLFCCEVSEPVFSFLFVQILDILSKISISGLVFGDLWSCSICVGLLASCWACFVSTRIRFCSFADKRSKCRSPSLEWEHAISYSDFGDFGLPGFRFTCSSFIVGNWVFRTKWPIPWAIILSSHIFSSILYRKQIDIHLYYNVFECLNEVQLYRILEQNMINYS